MRGSQRLWFFGCYTFLILCCVRWWRKPRGVPESARCSESLLFSTCRWCTFQTAFGGLNTPRRSFSAALTQGSTPPWAKYCCYVSRSEEHTSELQSLTNLVCR